MKFFQKKGVAIAVMVLCIALAAVWGIAHRPAVVTTEGGEALDTSLSTDWYRTFIVDNAGVLFERTEEALAIYDANWDEWSGSILSVVTVSSVSGTTEEAAWDWANQLQLGENDAILLLDTGGRDAYLLSSGGFADRFGGTEGSYLGAYLYEDFMAGNYDDGVLNLFAHVHLLFRDSSFQAHTTLVAEWEGVIVGFADLADDGYLDRLYVHKDYQGQGIATALCDALPRARLTHASLTARPFFEKRGWRVERAQQVERHGVKLTNFVMTRSPFHGLA